MIKLMIDGMDQSKFRVPRNLATLHTIIIFIITMVAIMMATIIISTAAIIMAAVIISMAASTL